MIIGEMQGKLAMWSTEDKERKFDRLLRLIADKSWLAEAARITLASSGARTPGVDGVDKVKMEGSLHHELATIHDELLARGLAREAGARLPDTTVGNTSPSSFRVRSNVRVDRAPRSVATRGPNSAAVGRSVRCPVRFPHATRRTRRLPHALTYLRTVAIEGECLPVASARSRRAIAGA